MPLPTTMTCIEIDGPGDADVLKPGQRPVPLPSDDEVLIKVSAAGVNRPDLIQRMGLYPPPPGASDIPGLEISGTIKAVGKAAGPWRVGDLVCALVTGGGYAEYCTASASLCLPVPAGLDMIAAAALPETFFTVWSNVFDRGSLAAGETFLVHGGTSGIGTTAIQLAHRLGARVIATASGPEKCLACLKLGADRAVDYQQEDFVAVAKELTGGKGVDVILDMVGGDYIKRDIRALASDGRLIFIAFLKGSRAEIDLMPVMLKRLTVTGSTLRARSIAFKATIAATLQDKIWPLIESGDIRPVIHQTFPLGEAAAAHRLMESNSHIGKIMLQP
jgi:NADPH2:quinone reductase